jgi:CRP/FNR family transcriptional regulator, cyclic AMP receptor protein
MLSRESNDRNPKPEFNPKALLERASEGIALKRYQKQQCIFKQGDPADEIGYLRRGRLKATILSGGGKEAIVGVFGQGQFFGEGALGSQAVRKATVVAMEECWVTLITRETLSLMLASEPIFSKFFVRHLLCRNDRLESDLVEHLLHSSQQRLARLLLRLAEAGPEEEALIPVSLNQEELADMIGTTRSRVSTFMNRFREKGFISYDSSGKIHVYAAMLLAAFGS